MSQKPILVTGATGYIASHIVKQLLEEGHKVRGTVRSLANTKRNEFLYELVPSHKDNLQLVEADLLKPETWAVAVEGVDYVIHVASPFVIDTPKDENVLIKPAVDGTLNVLQASLDKGVKRVVVTSSVAAAMYGNEHKILGPEDWSNIEMCSAYSKSKTLAEKAAWNFWEDHKGKIELATVLPAFVVGKCFTHVEGASERIIIEMLTGKLPGIPRITLGTVDVGDLAKIHIKALFSPNSNGKRYIASAKTLYMSEVSKILDDEFGKYGYKVTKWNVPDWLIKFMGLFDKQAAGTKPELGVERKFNHELAVKDLGIEFRDTKESIKELAYSLIELGAVPNLINKQKESEASKWPCYTR